jgi:hypothetical protein
MRILFNLQSIEFEFTAGYMTAEYENANLEIFRDCLSVPLISNSTTQPSKAVKRRKAAVGRKNAVKPVQVVKQDESNDGQELAEFIDVWFISILNRGALLTPS